MSLEECVKTEPEWDDECGVSEAAACAGLYEGHRVKDELVIGPELLQPRDVAYTLGLAPDESWLKIGKQDPTSDQPNMMNCEQPPTTESQSSQPLQLRDCFVKLERITLDKPFDYEPEVQSPTDEDKLRNKNNQKQGGEVKKKKTYICDTCNKQFLNRQYFIIHIRIHTGLKPYTCGVCEKKFACVKYLAKHKLTHEDRLFSCELCEQKFTLKGSLKRHKLIHTEEKRYSCEVCSKKLASRNSLDRHKLTHTGERPFSCGICEKQYRHKSGLVIHMKMHTQETYESDQKFMSNQISYNSKKQQQYTRKKIHKHHYKETCDICKKQFFSWYLTAHKQTHTKPFQCEVCEKKFSFKRSLLSHYTVHTGVKVFSCEKCKMKFTTIYRLRNHKLTHMLPFSCEICNKEFKRKDSFVNHKLLHTGEKQFPCEFCKKQFRQKSSLMYHLRTHDESVRSRKFSCEICGYQSTRAARLTIHRRKHTGEKPFSCNICEKRFIDKSTVTVHMRIHTGEKPYGCGTCGKRFISSGNFNQHKRSHDSELKDKSCLGHNFNPFLGKTEIRTSLVVIE